MPSELERLATLMRRSARTVVLTGAGISTESGIPDFRGPGGIWEGVDPMEVGHIRAARRDPARVWEYYRRRVGTVRAARPNAGHLAIARMQRAGRVHALVTQNVDGLHAAAGSQAIEVHGSLRTANCMDCGVEIAMPADPVGVPCCAECGGPLKPGVVMFGEMLPEAAIMRANELAASCELLIAAGSTLEVWPVAELPAIALDSGAALAVLNRGPTGYDDRCHVRIEGPLGEVLPALAESVGA
ncbi:MAG TPA: NAD-dependent deacylase [Gaiellales bacterium]|jgi:NAD-dependent deacetylase|nr:NAD-dependent deacylase [Gaiellales bacterium]